MTSIDGDFLLEDLYGVKMLRMAQIHSPITDLPDNWTIDYAKSKTFYRKIPLSYLYSAVISESVLKCVFGISGTGVVLDGESCQVTIPLNYQSICSMVLMYLPSDIVIHTLRGVDYEKLNCMFQLPGELILSPDGVKLLGHDNIIILFNSEKLKENVLNALYKSGSVTGVLFGVVRQYRFIVKGQKIM